LEIMLSKPELGMKFTCISCAGRFYDLCRTPAVCPRCSAEQPAPKPRALSPMRAAGRRWSSGGYSPRAEVAEEPVAADEAAEVVDDAEAVEAETADDDEDEVASLPDDVGAV
jgi:uncharacterized protein (TIGR02300 family)